MSKNIDQIKQTVFQNVMSAYDKRVSLLSTAAILATLPNWKSVLDKHIDSFKESMQQQANENKTKMGQFVPVEELLLARTAVASTVDIALDTAHKHHYELFDLVESLQTESNSTVEAVNQLPEAVMVVSESIQNDSELAWGYYCNIKMPIYDNLPAHLGHDLKNAVASKSAAHIMRVFYDVEIDISNEIA